MEHIPSWEANRFSASREIPHILWKLKVHYRIHRSLPPVPLLSQIDAIHAPYPTSWRSILMLSSFLRLGLLSILFPSFFATKILYTPLLSPIRAIFPDHLIRLDLITQKMLGQGYRSLSSTLCGFLHSLVTSSLSGPNIPFITLFPDTLSLRFSLNVSDHVSRPYNTTSKVMVLYILIFKFLGSKLEDRRFCTEWTRMTCTLCNNLLMRLKIIASEWVFKWLLFK